MNAHDAAMDLLEDLRKLGIILHSGDYHGGAVFASDDVFISAAALMHDERFVQLLRQDHYWRENVREVERAGNLLASFFGALSKYAGNK